MQAAGEGHSLEKQPKGEFDSVSEATSSDNATIHGVVTSLSPMKLGKRSRYFEAKLTDGKKHMRMIGFRGDQRYQLASYHDSAQSVALHNCEVKPARQSEELQIVMRSSTRVQASPKKFDIDCKDVSRNIADQISLSGLDDKNTFDRVSLAAKVLNVEEPSKVSGDLTKQDITIADRTAAARMTLWEADIGHRKSYKLTIVVHTYQGSKYLTMPKEGANLDEIADIGEVAADDIPENVVTAHDVEVIGVQTLDSYPSCVACIAKSNQL